MHDFSFIMSLCSNISISKLIFVVILFGINLKEMSLICNDSMENTN